MSVLDQYDAGIRNDNRIENLMLLEHGSHSQVTNAERSYKKGYELNITDERRCDLRSLAKSSNRDKGRFVCAAQD